MTDSRDPLADNNGPPPSASPKEKVTMISNRGRRTAVAAVVAAALAFLGLPTASSANANAVAAIPPATLPATVTADPLPNWQITGVVWSQVLVGNTVYATGSFTKARPPGMWQGGPTEITVGHLIAYDITTGQRVASFNHVLNAQGLTVTASPDGSRIYVGGDFTLVDGVARSHIAAFDTATGNLSSSFAPAINGQVRAITATSSTVYAGGAFESAAGVARNRLASFNAANGVMSTTWAPTARDGYVYALVLTPDKSKVVVGGQFMTLNTSAVYGMGAVDATTGATLPWAANAVIRDPTNGAINSLKTDGTSIFGSGFAFGAGASFEGTFSLNPANGNINWLNDCHGDTYDVQPVGSVVYSVSHAHDCTAIGSYPDTNPRVRWQHALATTSYATGTNSGPDSYGWNYNGQPASSILPWYPDLGIGTATGQFQAAWSVTGNSTFVVLGGEFPTVNGGEQQGLTRFAVRAAAPNKRGPQYTTTPSRPTPPTVAQSLTPGAVRVSFGTAWDMDDPRLTYQVTRDNLTVVYTTTADTSFWTLPGLGFVDRSLAPGSTHTYQVRISDPSGNVLLSPVSNTVTVSSATQSRYAQDVSTDGASHYWRFGEPSGSTAYDWTGFEDLGLNAAVARGAAGAINGDADGASTFDGISGVGVDPSAIVGPSVFSQEAWFKTTSTTGGKIVGFGNRPSGNSTSYDRHIYMDPQGKVWFGVFNNGAFTVNTPTPANDGQWHHAVGTMDASGITLYLDGLRIGHNSGTSTAQAYTGYWRVGGDTSWSGNPYFNGVVDDVAIYSTALSINQVQSHYVDSGRTVVGGVVPNQPPVSSFTAAANGLVASFDGSASSDPDGTVAAYAWDFGDQGTAAGPKPSHTYAAPGAYTVKLTVIDDKGASSVSSRSVTVTNLPPVASFTAAANGLVASFDGSASSDPDGTVAAYTWDFGDQATATVAKPSHTYAAAGTYTVTLTVTDNRGATNIATKTLTLVANQAPVASFTSSATDLVASFDGSASSDPDGTVASYSWDFGDQGTAAVTKPSHTYAAAGTYPVRLTVTDDKGATNTATRSVVVSLPFARDIFARTVSNGWGAADTGGAWTTSGGAASFGVNAGVGRLVTPAAATGVTATLDGVSSSNTDLQLQMSVDKASTGGGQFFYVIGRGSSSDGYRAKIWVSSTGSMVLSLNRYVGGVETELTNKVITGSYVPGETYQLRLQVFGTGPTSLQANLWKVGTAEPAAWAVTATDSTASLQQAGPIGLVTYVSKTATNAPITISIGQLFARTR